MEESINFQSCIDDCGLTNKGFYGNKFTWSYNRGFPRTIWKRLDRVLINSKWTNISGETMVIHLARVGSYHAPLLININTTDNSGPKYLKFLDFWAEHKDFVPMVQEI